MSKPVKQEQICSVCEAEPEDMLILSCHHNLCLDCATEVYNIGSKQDKLVCEICLGETNLDNQTIVCLRSLSAKNVKLGYENSQNRSNYPPVPTKTTFQATSNYIQNPINNRQIGSYTIKQSQFLPQQQIFLHSSLKCQKHNQPLTYYCMQCNIYKICSQCMLMDNHRYHKVFTLKKAGQYIKQSIQKIGKQKIKLKNLLNNDKDNLIAKKEESQKLLNINLNYLKGYFDQLTVMIFKKYEEIKVKIQQQSFRKLEIMQGAINQINEKISLIQQTIQFQNQLISSVFTPKTTNSNSIFQMFQYYQTQMNQNQINFQPSLPNYISEVEELKLNKQQIFQEVQMALNNINWVVQKGVQEEDENMYYDENINHMSDINVNNLIRGHQGQENAQNRNGQNQSLYDMRRKMREERIGQSKRLPQYQNGSFNFNPKRSHGMASQNINIIQFGQPNLQKNQKSTDKKDYKIISSIPSNNPTKRSKQSIEAIKRKARQNLKDRQLSNSRKMELSRSIVNATDILNKIQERTSRM